MPRGPKDEKRPAKPTAKVVVARIATASRQQEGAPAFRPRLRRGEELPEAAELPRPVHPTLVGDQHLFRHVGLGVGLAIEMTGYLRHVDGVLPTGNDEGGDGIADEVGDERGPPT